MKNTRMNLLGVFAFVTTMILVAAGPLKSRPTAAEAAAHDHEVKRVLREYKQNGYTLFEEYEYAYRYLTPPVGDYLWGECVYVLRHDSDDPGKPAAFVTVTVYVDYVALEKGYLCSGMEVLEETFY